MNKKLKRTLAGLSAAGLLIGTSAVAVGEDATPALELPEAVIGKEETSVRIGRGYIYGEMTVGASDEENAIASSDGELYLYKRDSTLILGADGGKMSFDDISEGDVIEYFVNENTPATLQLPVHYSADIIVVTDKESPVFTELSSFNGELVNEENTLALNMGEDTVLYGGEEFTGGKALVIYTDSTKSIPAQTVPVAVVILEEEGQADEPAKAADLSGVKEITVGETVLGYIPISVNNVQMLPVRAYAEALGFDVKWIDETRTVYVGKAYFSLDEDAYVIGKAMPQSLGQAPVMFSLPGDEFALTYVPVTFFTEILGAEITVDGETAEMALR